MPFPFLEKIHEETLSLSKRRVTETRPLKLKVGEQGLLIYRHVGKEVFLHGDGGLFSHQYLCVTAVIQMQPGAELCLSTINAEQPPWYWSGFPSGWLDHVLG